MNSFLYHVQLNIDFANLDFYQELMQLLGWEPIFTSEEVAGFHSRTTGDIWFVKTTADQSQDYDLKGVNHLGIRVEKQNDVDEVVTFLNQKGIKPLFETPRHRPEFAASEADTYYQVMFETPDKILLEITYVGSKS